MYTNIAGSYLGEVADIRWQWLYTYRYKAIYTDIHRYSRVVLRRSGTATVAGENSGRGGSDVCGAARNQGPRYVEVSLSVCLSACLSVCLFVCLSVCLS
jgi:hypothetical protein